MKKILTLSGLAMAMLFSSMLLIPAESAEARNLIWRKYRLKFWLPNGMKTTTNRGGSFIAKGKGIVLKIKAWRGRYSTSVSAAKFGYRTYRVIKGKRILVRKRIRSSRARGLWRYLYVGKGFYRGKQVYWAVIGMAGKGTRNKFYVRMWWPKWRHKWVLPRISKIARRMYAY